MYIGSGVPKDSKLDYVSWWPDYVDPTARFTKRILKNWRGKAQTYNDDIDSEGAPPTVVPLSHPWLNETMMRYTWRFMSHTTRHWNCATLNCSVIVATVLTMGGARLICSPPWGNVNPLVANTTEVPTMRIKG